MREEKGGVRWRENNSSGVCIHVCDFVCVCVCLHVALGTKTLTVNVSFENRLHTNKKNERVCVSVFVRE